MQYVAQWHTGTALRITTLNKWPCPIGLELRTSVLASRNRKSHPVLDPTRVEWYYQRHTVSRPLPTEADVHARAGGTKAVPCHKGRTLTRARETAVIPPECWAVVWTLWSTKRVVGEAARLIQQGPGPGLFANGKPGCAATDQRPATLNCTSTQHWQLIQKWHKLQCTP